MTPNASDDDLKRSRKRKLACTVLCIVFLLPFPTEVAPKANVRVVDAGNKPVQYREVMQTSQNYSVESSAHYEKAKTDANGIVVFPRRTVWASVAHRILGPVFNFVTAFVHASFGPTVWFTVQGGSFSEQNPAPGEYILQEDPPLRAP